MIRRPLVIELLTERRLPSNEFSVELHKNVKLSFGRTFGKSSRAFGVVWKSAQSPKLARYENWKNITKSRNITTVKIQRNRYYSFEVLVLNAGTSLIAR